MAAPDVPVLVTFDDNRWPTLSDRLSADLREAAALIMKHSNPSYRQCGYDMLALWNTIGSAARCPEQVQLIGSRGDITLQCGSKVGHLSQHHANTETGTASVSWEGSR